MGTPAQIGKREFRDAISEAHTANRKIKTVLQDILQAPNASHFIQTLAGRAAIALLDSEIALERLDEIGKQSKPAP